MKSVLNLFLILVVALFALVAVGQGIRLYQENQSTTSKAIKAASKYASEAKETVVDSYKAVEQAVKK